MSTQTRLMTADELFRLPEDGWQYELVRGELRKMSPGAFKHGRIAMKLSIRLGQYVLDHNLGVMCAAETGFVIATDPDTVRCPDIAFVSQERVEEVDALAPFGRGAPDLVGEVISQNDVYKEVDEKVADWLAAGTRLVWVVNPRHKTITVYQPNQPPVKLTVGDQLDGGEVVPGWTFPVREVFS